MKSFLRALFASTIFICFLMSMSACTNVVRLIGNLELGADKNEAVVSKYDYDCGLYYCYNQLSEEDKEIYRVICDQLSYYNFEIYVKIDDFKKLKQIYQAVFYDHPEFFFITGSYKVQGYMLSKKVIINAEKWVEDEFEFDKYTALLNSYADEIVNAAKKYPTLFEQVLYVHDYLVDNIEYDDKTRDLLEADPYSKGRMEYSCIYGAFLEKSAVCSGYATAFQFIMQKMGIECGIATGDLHEWNFVQLDGKYYYIDVTWDDSDFEDGAQSYRMYEFFCIPTDELLLTRSLEEDILVPECTAEDYNYYVYNGYYCEKYNKNTVESIFENQAYNDVLYIKFGSADEADKAIENYLDTGDIYDISALWDYDMSYYTSLSGLCIDIVKE